MPQVDWSKMFLNGAKSGDLDQVKESLMKVEDRNVTDFLGHNALTLSIINDQPEVAKYLIESGQNLNIINNVYSKFSRFCGTSKVKYLTEYNGDSFLGATALICAVRKRNFDLVQKLIENGASVNEIGVEDSTALEDAILRRCDRELIEFLINSGADTNRAKIKLDEFARQHPTFATYWEEIKELMV